MKLIDSATVNHFHVLVIYLGGLHVIRQNIMKDFLRVKQEWVMVIAVENIQIISSTDIQIDVKILITLSKTTTVINSI